MRVDELAYLKLELPRGSRSLSSLLAMGPGSLISKSRGTAHGWKAKRPRERPPVIRLRRKMDGLLVYSS